MDRFADMVLDGCSAASQALAPMGDTQGARYVGCQDDADVVLYTIEGGGHTWSGGPQLPFFGKTSRDIDASAVMWAFFKGRSDD